MRLRVAAILLVVLGWLGRVALASSEEPAATSGQVLILDSRTGRGAWMDKVQKPDDEWRKQLSPEQYRVTRQRGTERAFTGPYHNHHEPGIYRCVCCGIDLYSSTEKFDSGTGWPSFWNPVSERNVRYEAETSLFIRRIEVRCVRCDAHLGHVFDDGPPPTGKRHCINSAALAFMKIQHQRGTVSSP